MPVALPLSETKNTVETKMMVTMTGTELVDLVFGQLDVSGITHVHRLAAAMHYFGVKQQKLPASGTLRTLLDQRIVAGLKVPIHTLNDARGTGSRPPAQHSQADPRT